jgi:hypothetical protein
MALPPLSHCLSGTAESATLQPPALAGQHQAQALPQRDDKPPLGRSLGLVHPWPKRGRRGVTYTPDYS